jgi:hypothetical protein
MMVYFGWTSTILLLSSMMFTFVNNSHQKLDGTVQLFTINGRVNMQLVYLPKKTRNVRWVTTLNSESL